MTSVANIHHLKPGWEEDARYVYIGRAGKDKDGTFGNPYRLGHGNARGATLGRYARWLARRLQSDPAFRAKVEGLSGKILVCFCKPQACHGDILAHAADVLVSERWREEARSVFGDMLETSPDFDKGLPEIDFDGEKEYSDAAN